MNIRDQLLMAIQTNHQQAVAPLIRQVDQTIEIKNKKTFIQIAWDLKRWDCVDKIAETVKTDPLDKARYGYVLLEAVKEGLLNTVKLLLEAGASKTWHFTESEDQCLHVAVKRRDTKMLVLLLSYDFDLKIENKERLTAIQLACDLKYWIGVEEIAKNKKTDETDQARYGYALVEAVNAGRHDTVRLLLNAGASKTWSFETTGNRCVHVAVKSEDYEMIALLLSFGFDLTVENNDKLTPIQLASQRRDWLSVEEIAKQKNTDATDQARYGCALLDAVKAGHCDTAELLLKAGASKTWYVSDTGNQCVHVAAEKNDSNMLALLWWFNFDMTVRNNKNQTPAEVNPHCFQLTWKIYFNKKYLEAINILILLTQASNTEDCKLGIIPINYFFQFLCDKNIFGTSDVVLFGKKYFPRTFAKHFLNSATSPGLLNSVHAMFFHSEASEKLLTDVKKNIEDAKSTPEEMQDTINQFLIANNGKETRTFELLKKYPKLMDITNNSLQKKEEWVMVPKDLSTRPR